MSWGLGCHDVTTNGASTVRISRSCGLTCHAATRGVAGELFQGEIVACQAPLEGLDVGHESGTYVICRIADIVIQTG